MRENLHLWSCSLDMASWLVVDKIDKSESIHAASNFYNMWQKCAWVEYDSLVSLTCNICAICAKKYNMMHSCLLESMRAPHHGGQSCAVMIGILAKFANFLFLYKLPRMFLIASESHFAPQRGHGLCKKYKYSPALVLGGHTQNSNTNTCLPPLIRTVHWGQPCFVQMLHLWPS